MKIAAFLGSPHPHGTTGTLLDAFREGATGAGHEVTLHHLYRLDIKPCQDCGHCKGEHESCCQRDDFTTCQQAIEAADGILIASPIYFGQITGPTKTWLDRWCMYFGDRFAIRKVSGKRYMTITASAAPAERFKGVTEYLRYWFSDFFKMRHAGSLIAGDVMRANDLEKRPELLGEARALGAGADRDLAGV